MYHRPVCVKCNVELKAETNGVGLVDMASFGEYKVWESDLYKCPCCGYEIIVDFGQQAVAEHFEKDRFAKTLDFYRGHSQLVRSWSSVEAKPSEEAE